MGLFDWIFKNRPKVPTGTLETEFRMLNGYVPRFRSFDGGLYEAELIRSAINARAMHISKLDVSILGSAKPALRAKLEKGPNSFQTWGQFLYRLSTILDVHNTAFITPIFDDYGQPSGYYTPLPDKCEIKSFRDTPYLVYTFGRGDRAAVELDLCGVMTKFQHRSDFFGEGNRALRPTMELINIQNQGIEEGVKSAATYRFMAQMDNFVSAEDLTKERERFSEKNFSREAKGGGVLLFPNTYKNIQQLKAQPWVIEAEQMNVIKANVFDYFGVNEDVLQNKAFGDAWSAFYEGAIEPFAIQFSDVMTKATFTLREQGSGNRIFASSNRLQYMSNADKLQVSAQMADRGLMTRNEIREIWNLAPLPDPIGKQLPIRGEYYNVGDNAGKSGGNGEENGNE